MKSTTTCATLLQCFWKTDETSMLETEVTPFKEFWPTEEYHQHYLVKHPHGYTCHLNRDCRLGE